MNLSPERMGLSSPNTAKAMLPPLVSESCPPLALGDATTPSLSALGTLGLQLWSSSASLLHGSCPLAAPLPPSPPHQNLPQPYSSPAMAPAAATFFTVATVSEPALLRSLLRCTQAHGPPAPGKQLRKEPGLCSWNPSGCFFPEVGPWTRGLTL